MDHRAEPRYDLNQPVTITVLGVQEIRMSGRMANVSGRGMQLLTEAPLPYNSAVKVDWDDLLVLGEVIYSEQKNPGAFVSGLQLQEALTNLQELAKLCDVLSGESGAPPRLAKMR
jgi:hypothetical protein